jgi:hypothetical protein
MNGSFKHEALSKVPEVTLAFWVIKIAATTLGETGGDTVTMTLNWGYRSGTILFLGLLIVLVLAQSLAQKFQAFLYWGTIVASTTFGTTMADFADRSLGIGYTGGSTLLVACLMAVLGLWYWSERPQGWRPSIGRRSLSRRPSAPRSAIGWPTLAVSAMRVVRWFLLPRSRWSWASTPGATSQASCCSGQPSF